MARSDRTGHPLFGGFTSDLERMIRDFVEGPASLAREGLWSPPTDVYDAGERVVVRMEIPGVLPGDMDVTVVGDRLVIRGRRREEESACRTCYRQMEIHYGAFLRVVPLPEPIDRDGVRATYRDGFLAVEVPFLAEKPAEDRPVRVRVETGGEG
jgi:HSP20 family protein